VARERRLENKRGMRKSEQREDKREVRKSEQREEENLGKFGM